ncbi:MAG: hypothetical protein OEZ35_08685 [Candidatus Bathyarchaeota archaeon]|nr:hypothetical protein [Candidatus Bathyarchaeota archaeon]
MKETQQLKKTSDILRELAEDWRVNVAIINDVARRDGAVLKSVKRLCREYNQGNMVKIGLTLIAFPLPIVIDDVLGWAFVAGGLIQRRIKNSALYLEDVNKIFPNLIKELQEIKQEVV